MKSFFGSASRLTRLTPRPGRCATMNAMDDQATAEHPDSGDQDRASTRYSPAVGCWSTARSTTALHRRPHSRADIVVLDIEDAVAPKDKSTARDNVIRWLGEGNSDWVRVNGFGTPWWADDLEILSRTSVGGVMLAMVESVDHVTETAKRLPNVPIVALVETARGLERITEIAATKGTFRLAFGIGDFRRDTGFGDNPTTLAYARSRFTIAAKAAHLPERDRRADRRLQRAEAQRGDSGLRRVRHDRQDLPDTRPVPDRERGTVPVRRTKSAGPRSFSSSSSATAARSATAPTYHGSPGPTRSSIWPAPTASSSPSSTTSTTRHTSPRRRTPTTTEVLRSFLCR